MHILCFVVGSTPIVTTINLQHTLRIDYQPLSYPSNPPENNNPIGPEEVIGNPFFNNPRRVLDVRPLFPPRQPLPDESTSLTNTVSVPQYDTNQYNFNPIPPKSGSNSFNITNFKYRGNPFLSASTNRPLIYPVGKEIYISFVLTSQF